MRKRNAIGWGLFVVLFTALVYSMVTAGEAWNCDNNAGECTVVAEDGIIVDDQGPFVIVEDPDPFFAVDLPGAHGLSGWTDLSWDDKCRTDQDCNDDTDDCMPAAIRTRQLVCTAVCTDQLTWRRAALGYVCARGVSPSPAPTQPQPVVPPAP